jgi:hypothetical protein
MFFLLMSVFPYSGFMVMFLIKDGSVDNENAGKYAGFLSSSIMVGRAFSCTFLVATFLQFGRSVHVPTHTLQEITFLLSPWLGFSFHISLSFFFFFSVQSLCMGKNCRHIRTEICIGCGVGFISGRVVTVWLLYVLRHGDDREIRDGIM